MSTNIERAQTSIARPTSAAPTSRRVERAMSALRDRTLLELANVQAYGMVQNEKLLEIDDLSETAMIGQAQLGRLADLLSGDDPLAHEECWMIREKALRSKLLVIDATTQRFVD